MALYVCEQCGIEFKRSGKNKARFCSIGCKAEYQRSQKPVSKEWLYQKYISEGMSTYQIAKIVDRDPKRVWEWLKDLEIPTRERQWSVEPNSQPFHSKEWLQREYVEKGRSSSEIGNEFGVGATDVLFFLNRYGIGRRTISETRKIKHWGLYREKNPMFGIRGSDNPNWKGGITPERQALYSSSEWREVETVVLDRDHGTCQRCGLAVNTKKTRFHIHHIIPFQVQETRLTLSNLVLLCHKCHRWVHSKANVNHEFIQGGRLNNEA